MNELHFPIICGRWDNGGGLFLCMNSCMYARMYVYLCICMLVCMRVRLSNDFINVKTETKLLICCEEIHLPTFYRQARFLLRQKFYRGRCLVCLIRSYTALPVNSVSVSLPLQRKNMYQP